MQMAASRRSHAFSKPTKWRPRRKLLTPTFHYDILKDFVPIYNRHARTLMRKFDAIAEGGKFVDVFCKFDQFNLLFGGGAANQQNNWI